MDYIIIFSHRLLFELFEKERNYRAEEEEEARNNK
jgi:hypothetical protein